MTDLIKICKLYWCKVVASQLDTVTSRGSKFKSHCYANPSIKIFSSAWFKGKK